MRQIGFNDQNAHDVARQHKPKVGGFRDRTQFTSYEANATAMDTLTLGMPATYRITVQGCLNSNWSTSFGDMSISTKSDENGAALSILTGALADQAALFGVLEHLYGLGFPLLSVKCLEVIKK